jgi:hypothetical protein
MIGADVRYKRLPGRRRGVFRTGSLWIADDHLLAIDSWRFTEQYKRYYLTDIQAITLQRRAKITPGSLALPLLITVALWLLAILSATMIISIARFGGPVNPIEPMLIMRFIGIGGVLAAAAIATYQLAAWFLLSCECRIHTTTSADELRSLHRVWFARRALRRIDDRIRMAQGELPADWETRLSELHGAGLAQPAPEGPVMSAEASAAEPEKAVNLPVLAALMALIAAAGVGAFISENRILNVGLLLLVIGAALFATIGALRTAGRLATIMRGLAAGAIVVLMAAYAVSSIEGMRESTRHTAASDPKVSEFFGRLYTPWLRRTPAVGATVFGVAGLAAAILIRRTRPQE